MEWDCLDDDPTRADAVFIPYCVALNVLHYVLDPVLNASVRHDADLSVFLAREQPPFLLRRQGHHHFLVVSRSVRDYAKPLATEPRLCGTTSLFRPLKLANFRFLPVKSPPKENRKSVV